MIKNNKYDTYVFNKPSSNMQPLLQSCSILIDELCQIIITPHTTQSPIFFTKNDILRVTSHTEDGVHLVIIEPCDPRMPCFIAVSTHLFFMLLNSIVTTSYDDEDPIMFNNIRDPRRVETPTTVMIDEECQLIIHLANGECVHFTKREFCVRNRMDGNGTHFTAIEVFDDTFPSYIFESHLMFFILMDVMVRIIVETDEIEAVEEEDEYADSTDEEIEDDDEFVGACAIVVAEV